MSAVPQPLPSVPPSEGQDKPIDRVTEFTLGYLWFAPAYPSSQRIAWALISSLPRFLWLLHSRQPGKTGGKRQGPQHGRVKSDGQDERDVTGKYEI